MKKKLPKFQNEDEEREFWAVHDSTKYIEWQNAKRKAQAVDEDHLAAPSRVVA